jgi:hypothetical protein
VEGVVFDEVFWLAASYEDIWFPERQSQFTHVLKWLFRRFRLYGTRCQESEK